MSKIKSLILGTAASVVAFAGAQAADLPVKAKAVQYVKICSLYGAGFYYIPGTDTCLKIGGYVAAEYDFAQARGTQVQNVTGTGGLRTRDADNLFIRARTNITFDTRTATEYGVVRAFYQHDIYYNTSNTSYNSAITANNWGGTAIGTAFVQFAGFTFGKAISVLAPQFAFPRTNASLYGFSDMSSGSTGVLEAVYTAELGNGLSITFGIEDASYARSPLYDNNTAIANPFNTAAASLVLSNSYQGQVAPDFVANVRFDQAWGSVFGGVRLRDLGMTYYGTTPAAVATAQVAPSEANGHADNVLAYAFVGGLQLKALPTGVGDTFSVLASYSDGLINASGDAGPIPSMLGVRGIDGGVNTLGYGVYADGVTGTLGGVNQGIQKTKSYGVQVGFEHYWVPAKWRTSLYGAYAVIDYNGTANALLCQTAQRATGGGGVGLSAGSNCDFDQKISQVGSRTVWTPVAGLDFSAEALYTHFDLPLSGTITNGGTAPVGFQPVGQTKTLSSQNVLTGQFRVVRNF